MGDLILPPPIAPVLTFEHYVGVTIAAGSSYTPATAGFYHGATEIPISYALLRVAYYSPDIGAWRFIRTEDYGTNPVFGIFISDGTNLAFYNYDTVSHKLILFRTGYSTPNPSPKVGKQILYGKPSIVLESDEKGFIWIEEEELTKLCEDIIPEVKEAKEKGEPHPLIGMTFTQAIKEDVEDKMGYGKDKGLLRGLGFDV